jgi:hypothetical protein
MNTVYGWDELSQGAAMNDEADGEILTFDIPDEALASSQYLIIELGVVAVATLSAALDAGLTSRPHTGEPMSKRLSIFAARCFEMPNDPRAPTACARNLQFCPNSGRH